MACLQRIKEQWEGLFRQTQLSSELLKKKKKNLDLQDAERRSFLNLEKVGKQEVDSKTLVPPHIEGMGTVYHGCIPIGGELCYAEMLSGQVKTAGLLQTR